MKRLSIELSIVAAILLVAATPVSADHGPYFYGGHEYWVRDAPCLSGWEAAEDYAISLGGQLVAINDSSENDFIVSIIGTSGGWWTGLTDEAVEGEWVWSNGDPTNYLNWTQPYEPNGGTGENCAEVLGPAGTWNDLPCDRCLGAVIEIVPPPPVTDDRVIETIAGNFNGNGFLATELPLWPTGGILFEPNGDILVNDYTEIYRIDAATDRVTRIAGIRSVSSSGDGGPATAASWASFGSFARDSAGNIYISDSFFYKVRRIATDGTITTVAGDGTLGYSGDGGLATSAQIGESYGVAINSDDELFVGDFSHHVVRKVDTSGIISTVAGLGYCDCTGDGGPATSATLCDPQGIGLDSLDNLYIADGCSTIRKVDTAGTITTVAGVTWTVGFSGDGGPATSAELYVPSQVAFDSSDNMFIADYFNYRVRMVNTAGTIMTVAGNGANAFAGDGGLATSASLSGVYGLTVDESDRLVIGDTIQNRRLRRVDDGVIDTIAGKGDNFFGDGQAAISASLSPRGMAFDHAGDLIFADESNYRLRKIDAAGVISTIAGTGQPGSGGDGGPATLAEFNRPTDLAIAGDESIYVADWLNHKIRKIDGKAGTIDTVAGTGTRGFSGDGGPATAAQFSQPHSIALAADGTYYIADRINNRIRRVTPGGTIETYAGDGNRDSYGDGGPATSAALNWPEGVALDAAGNLYIADTYNGSIRRVDIGGIITTFLSGLIFPSQLGIHPDGDLLVTDDTQVLKVDSLGNVVVLTGGDKRGFSGDGGLAIVATISGPVDVIADDNDNIFISDAGNTRIRKIFTFIAAPPSVPLPTVSEEASGLAAGSTTGSSVAGLGDINGDGLDDFIAGAPGFQDTGGPIEAGAASVYLGSTSQADRATADIIFLGVGASDRTGVSVAGNFDFNGDGVNDFLIGAEQVDRTNPSNPIAVGPGKAYLIYFDPTDMTHYPNLGNPALEDRVDLSLVGQPGGVPGVVFLGGMSGDQAGFDTAGGATVSGLGGAEIAIGAPGRDTPGGVGAGTVYLIFNDPSLSGVIALSRVANGQSDQIEGTVYEGAAAGDALGFAVAFPGNVETSSGNDLAMGAPFADPDDGTRAPRTDAGSVFVAAGSGITTGIIEVCQIGLASGPAGSQIHGEQDGEELGSSVDGGGDALANGHDDLLMGAPGYDTNPVDAGRVFHSAGPLPQGIIEVCQIGDLSAAEQAPIDGVQYVGAEDGDRLGTAVAGVGDVTGDLIDDVALGAPFADPNGLVDAGTIYVAAGSTFVSNSIIEVCQLGGTVPGRQLTGTAPGEMAGSSIDAAGDLNGDATRDFVAGSPGSDLPGEEDTGSVNMVLETNDLSTGEPPPAGLPPVANAGEDQLLECQSDLSATALLDGSGSTDPDDDIASYEWDVGGIPIASGETASVTFDLGSHTVTLAVTDTTNLTDTDDVLIEVEDTTAPAITCPADVTVQCVSDLQAQVTLTPAFAVDGCNNGASISNSYTSGGTDASGTYPLGTTTVVFTAVDNAGNTAGCSTDVTVDDTIPPVITVVADPDQLWPPNHRLEDVHYDVTVVESCDPFPMIVLESITNSEGDDAVGGADGETTDDIQDADIGTADFDMLLRAERDGNGPGRTYTATYSATDAAGNVGPGSANTVVPHDQGGGNDEPIELVLMRMTGTTVSWSPVNGALEYDVIRGDLAAIQTVGSNYNLGPVVCIEAASPDTDTVGDLDNDRPAPGAVYFYLVQSIDDQGASAYGTTSASRSRVTAGGECR